MNVLGKAIGLAVLALLPVGLAAQTFKDIGNAFVWRINPSEYFFAEARFGTWFSHTNDVVFARTDGEGVPSAAITLVKKSDSSYKVSVFDFADPWSKSAGQEMRVRSASIDATIGQQIEAAVSFRLRGLVLLDPRPKDPEGLEVGGWWIFQRGKADRIGTALIRVTALHRNPEAQGFIHGLVENLGRYVNSSEAERPEVGALVQEAAKQIAKGEIPERY